MSYNVISTLNKKSVPSRLVELWVVRLLVKTELWKALNAEHIRMGNASEAQTKTWFKFAQLLRKAAQCVDRSDVDVDDADELTLAELFEIIEDHKLKFSEPLDYPPQFLKKELAAIEKAAKNSSLMTKALEHNLNTFAKSFELSACECQLIAWIIMLHVNEELRELTRYFDFSKGGQELWLQVFCLATDSNYDEATRAIAPDSKLMSSGLLRSLGIGENDAEDWFGFFHRPNEFIHRKMTLEEAFSETIKPAPKAELTLKDFSQNEMLHQTMIPYLREALASRKKGVNILLYGAPGTGKTQMSRVIAEAVGGKLVEVARESITVRIVEKIDRLDHWVMANRWLANSKNTVILVDEAEDIFNDGVSFLFMRESVRTNKAQINNLLETNECPTIWTTNNIRSMDPAMLRRFDIIEEVELPTKDKRQNIIEKEAAGFLSEAVVARLSSTAKLSPAVLTRAIDVVKTLGKMTIEERSQMVVNLVEQSLKAQGLGMLASTKAPSQAIYSTEFVNASMDLDAIEEGLKNAKGGRLCLYGVPGTGKTAWAQHVGNALGIAVKVCKASDLLDCYVGNTEKNIARVFAQAKAEKAMLVIDEADSFLQDRKAAMRSWEVTQVNEMLTQIEAFDGIFIATTNLVDDLDAASLRRFDLKIKFDAMKPEQTLALFKAHAKALKLKGRMTAQVTQKVLDIRNATPGDFASVLGGSRLTPMKNVEDFADRLVTDVAFKDKRGSNRQAIGF